MTLMEDFSQYNPEGSTLMKMQLRILDIMVEIDRICRKHDIGYWIDFGTLLGAVRHGGFIPWDDDLDIAMTSDDFRRFMEIAPTELPSTLFLQTRSTDPSYNMLVSKVRDRNSFFITQHEDFTKDYQKGLYVDIFEVKSYPNAPKKLQKSILRWYKKIYFFYSVKQDVNVKNHLAALVFPIIKLSLDLLWGLLNLLPKSKLGYEKHFSPYGNSYTKDMVFPLKDIEFEGKTFLGPSDPDRYLTSIYKDYMTIPPKEKRITHIIHVEMN